MKIYFAGSIRGGRSDQALYHDMISALGKHGTVLTEHIGLATVAAMGEEGVSDEYIYKRDMDWIREADAVVAEVSTPSLGVGYELAMAETLGKKIICLFRPDGDRRLSAMISGAGVFPIKEYETLEEAEEIFNQFFK